MNIEVPNMFCVVHDWSNLNPQFLLVVLGITLCVE
jgi:hypothetical protein